MRIKKYLITLMLALFASSGVYSQESRTEIRVDFRVNISTLDMSFSDNAKQISEIVNFLQKIRQDSTLKVLDVSFCGSASPEGSYQINRQLARARLQTLERVVRREVEIPDSIISRDDSYISWDYLKEQVSNSDLSHKQEVLDIINLKPQLVDYYGGHSIDHRIVKLKALDGGKVWQHLYQKYFARMRNAYVVFVTFKREPKPVVEQVALAPRQIEFKPAMQSLEIPQSAPEADRWHRHLYLKTNTLGWGMAITNLAVEVDLCKHLSFTLPIYYSAYNYFTSTIKFRTLMIQPELRFWPKAENQGFFVGGHFGYAQYNLATDGNYRYQDHNGKSPALGGGLAVGYRMPISKNKRWGMEFTVGAGGYKLHYDKFYNTDHTVNGLKIDSHKRTYWGLDQAAISFSYMFDLNKKGGKR